MIRSMYISATGMFTQRQRMDVITNNIANVDTTGYKADQAITRSFEDMLISRINDQGRMTQVGPLNTGAYMDGIATNFTSGNVESTGISTNMCIQGSGFFPVQTPDGVRYTRAGAFTMDVQGNLVTPEGFPLLGEGNAPIRLEPGAFSVSATGDITQKDAIAGRVNIVDFADTTPLRKVGDNLFDANGAQTRAAEGFTVLQGAVETSNVNEASEASDMITVSRLYEANQRMLRASDEMLGRAVNDIARF